MILCISYQTLHFSPLYFEEQTVVCSTCEAKGHTLPRGVWGHPPKNFWNLKPANTINCILSIEIRFKICGKSASFSHQNKKKRTKVSKFIHQQTTSTTNHFWKSNITVVRKFSNVHHLETAAQRQLGKMFIWLSSIYRSSRNSRTTYGSQEKYFLYCIYVYL